MAREAIVGEFNVQEVDAANDTSALVRLDISYPVSLKIAVAGRAQVIDLADEEWSDAGVYLLLDRPHQHGVWSAYVGKSAASGGVKRRLKLQLKDPDKSSWYRAVAVCPTDGGWDEADVAFLEGSIYRALSELPGVSLSNTQEPGTGRLAAHRQMRLRKVPDVLAGVLHILGHPAVADGTRQDSEPESADVTVVEKPSQPGKLAGLLHAGLVDVGTRLVPVDPRWSGEGTVTANGDIDIAGKTHSSPSGAGIAISKRKAESGWEFWAVGSLQGPTLHQLRDQLASGLVTPATREPAQDTDPVVSTEAEDRPEDEPGDTASRERTEGETAAAEGQQSKGVRLGDLVAAGLIPAGAKIFSTSSKRPAEGRVLSDGRVEFDNHIFEYPSGAATSAVGGKKTNRRNGWTFWALDSPQGERLAEIRERFIRTTLAS